MRLLIILILGLSSFQLSAQSIAINKIKLDKKIDSLRCCGSPDPQPDPPQSTFVLCKYVHQFKT